MSTPIPSSWHNFPTTENPHKKFKFVSCEFNINLDRYQWSRQTYNILDWLGDCGGLFDALMYISKPLLAPFSAFAVQSLLYDTFFRYKMKQKGPSPIPTNY